MFMYLLNESNDDNNHQIIHTKKLNPLVSTTPNFVKIAITIYIKQVL